MRKKLLITLLCATFLTGCTSQPNSNEEYVSKSEYDKVVAERDSYKEELEQLKTSDKETEKAVESVPEKTQTDEDLSKSVGVKEYYYVNRGWGTYYIMEVTNNSNVTIRVETNVIAKDGEGKTIGASSGSEEAIESGYSVLLFSIFDSEDVQNFEYTLTAKEDDYYKPVMSDLDYEVSDTGDGLVVTCTNKGEEAAEFVEGQVIFLNGDEVVGYETSYFTDSDSELKPNSTLAKEFDYYGDSSYDNYKIYFTGRR